MKLLASFVVVLVLGGTSMIKWFEAPRELLVGEPIAVIAITPSGAGETEESSTVTPSNDVDMAGTGLESIIPEVAIPEATTPVLATPEDVTPETATPVVATPAVETPDPSSGSPLGDGDEESDDAFAQPLSALPPPSATEDVASNPEENPVESSATDLQPQGAPEDVGSADAEGVNESTVVALPPGSATDDSNSGSNADEKAVIPVRQTNAPDLVKPASVTPSQTDQEGSNDVPYTASTPTATDAAAPTELSNRQSPEIPLPVPPPKNSQSSSDPDQTTASRVDHSNLLNEAGPLQADDQARIEAEKRKARLRARARERAVARAAQLRAQQLAAAKAKAEAASASDWKSDVFGDD